MLSYSFEKDVQMEMSRRQEEIMIESSRSELQILKSFVPTQVMFEAFDI